MTDTSPGSEHESGEPRPKQPSPRLWFPPPGQGQPPPGGGYGGPGGYPPAGGPHGQPGGYPPPGGEYGQPGGHPPPGGQYGQPRGYAYWPPRPQAPKPGVIALRPLGVGEMLDGAFTLIRRNPRATLGTAAVLLTISAVVSTATSLVLINTLGPVTVPNPGQRLTTAQATHVLHQIAEVFLPLIGVAVVLGFAVDIVLTGLLTVVIGRSVLGHRVTAGQAWRTARARLPALLGVTILIPLVILGIWLVAALVVVVVAVAHAPGGVVALIAVPAVIAALCLSIALWIMFRMAGPAVVLERQRPAASLRRSWDLVRGSFWRVFGITLLAVLIVIVTRAILQIPFAALSALASGGGSPFAGGALLGAGGSSDAGVIISAIGSIVAGSVAFPISAGVAVLLYVDLRMRREGLDLVLQTAAAGGEPGGGEPGGGEPGDEFASVWRPGARPAHENPSGAASSPPGGAAAPPPGGTPPGGVPQAW